MVRKPLLDELDRKILNELERDARASNRAIARRVGVSAPTVAQRIKRMEDVGLIRGYRVDLALPASGESSVGPSGVRCAECKGDIHGPARIRRFNDHSYAFCCPRCESTYEDRFKRWSQKPKTLGAAVLLLGWVGAFGTLAVGCFGMGTCNVGPMTTVPGFNLCPPWVRPRDGEAATLPAETVGLLRAQAKGPSPDAREMAMYLPHRSL